MATQAELAQQGKFYDALLSAVGDGVCAWDLEDRAIYANAALERVWCLSRDEWYGKTAAELGFSPEHVALFPRQRRQVVETGQPVAGETFYERPNIPGGGMWLDYIFSPVFGPDGTVQRVVGITRNATRRKSQEIALKDTQESQAFLLRLSDRLRALTDPYKIMTVASEAMARALNLATAQYQLVEEDEDTAEVVATFNDGRVPGFEVGYRHRLSDTAPRCRAGLRAGHELFSDDQAADPRGGVGVVTPEAGSRAGFAVPLTREGRLVALLCGGAAEPRWWIEPERQLVREVAERTWAAVERARAEGALRESQERYRTLFNSMAQGFCILEILFDGSEAPIDYRYVEINPAFERQTGMKNALGRTMRRLVPDIEPFWFDIFGEVALTGKPTHFVDYAKSMGRWFEVYAVRIGDPRDRQVAVLFNDITGRKEAENRQAFLLHLADALRPLSAALEIQDTVTRMLGEHLNADRAFYADTEQVADGAEDILMERIHCSPGTWANTGRFALDSLGPIVADLRAGRSVVISDVAAEAALTADQRAAYEAVEVRAFVGVPLIKAGRLAGIFGLHQKQLRNWKPAEIDLVQEVAERTWAAVERARTEAALRESEERQRRTAEYLEFTLEAFEAAEYDADPRTRTIRPSPRLNRLYGFPTDHRLTITDLYQSLHPDDQHIMASIVPAAEQRGEVRYQCEFRIVLPNRAVRWVLVRGQVTLDTEGRAMRLHGASVDITERKQAEDALRESEERYRLAMRAVNGIVYGWEVGKGIVRRTEGLKDVIGYDIGELPEIPEAWRELIHPDDVDRRGDMMNAIAEGRERFVTEYRMRHRAGHWVHVEDRGVVIYGENGKLQRVVGSATDITFRQQAEQRLRESRRRLRALVGGIPQLVWRATDAGEWTWSSPQWTAYTGQTEEESRGWGWLDALHPDDRSAARTVWAEAGPRGTLDVEYRIRRASDGDCRWFSTRATPVRDEDGTIMEWLGTSTDVDDLRQLQGEQEVLVAELQHRTRNLIGVVRSIVDRTLAGSPSLDAFQERFRDRMAALARVQGLLARKETGQRVTFDELIRTELAGLGVLGRDGGGPQVTLDGPEGVRLRSVTVQAFALGLHELATNALKYGALSKPEGHLTVHWNVDDGIGAERRLTVSWQESGVPVVETADGQLPRRGYGRELIERALPYQLQAETLYELTPKGVRCRIALPILD
jgi:PAS domain S-box-containing protein